MTFLMIFLLAPQTPYLRHIKAAGWGATTVNAEDSVDEGKAEEAASWLQLQA